MAPQVGPAPTAHIHYLSCFLQEICSWADLSILKSFTLFPWGCFFPPVYREKYATCFLKGVGRTQHVPAGTQSLPRVSVFLPSGRILLMLRTVIRLLTSLLMLWATPGYCRTECERAVLRLDDPVVQSKIKTPSSSTSTDPPQHSHLQPGSEPGHTWATHPSSKTLFKAQHLKRGTEKQVKMQLLATRTACSGPLTGTLPTCERFSDTQISQQRWQSVISLPQLKGHATDSPGVFHPQQ